MRHTLILIGSILTFSANRQIEPVNRNWNDIISVRETVIDTVPMVVYSKTESVVRQPAFYINGKLSSQTRLKTTDPMLIDSIHIEKKEIEIEGKIYYGQVFLKMKREYNPQIISLTDLVEKYTNIKSGHTIFMIDNDFIKDDYDQCLVDEKYLLKIIVDTIEKGKENVNVVRLLTKSKENIEKAKEIRIRGLGEIALN